jgi:hypothetical protein
MIILLAPAAACSSNTSISTASVSPTGSPASPGGGAVINSDSIVTAQIMSINQRAGGYAWEIDILIESSIDVDALPNPTKDSLGKTITVQTDMDMTPFKVGEVITARVKYAGDVPKPGIVLYMYNIAPEIHP